MKPFEELTRMGRIRRMRDLASEALPGWGIRNSHFKLLRQAGNTLFRVRSNDLEENEVDEDLFVKNNYLLRVHETDYQETEAIMLELSWLAAMRKEANLPVQEPIPMLDGEYLQTIQVAGIPGERNCSLLRWIKGHSVQKRFHSHHFKALGKLLAQLHNFSSQWNLPPSHFKRFFDWDGLFQNDVGSGMTNADAWALLSDRNRKAFTIVANRLKVVMEDWGQDKDFFGLIHGDLGLDANLLYWHGQPRAIDFDDSGFGYWIFDLAVALESVIDDSAYNKYKQALLEGYFEFRHIPHEQVDQLELFLCGLEIYWNLWATGGTHLYPEYLPQFQDRMATSAEYVVRTVESNFYQHFHDKE